MKPRKKIIYFDGSCFLCSTLKDKIESSSQKSKFISKDITQGKILPGLTKEQLMKEIHLVDEEGRVYKNIDAIFKVLETFPRLKILVKIGRFIVIKQFLRLLYRFISTNRHYLNGIIKRR